MQKTSWDNCIGDFTLCRLLLRGDRRADLLISTLPALMGNQLTPFRPPVVMSFSGVHYQEPAG